MILYRVFKIINHKQGIKMNTLEKSEDIIAYIKNSKKKTPIKIYIKGNLANIKTNAKIFSFGDFHFIVGDYEEIKIILEN